jgi:hypothetical protein
MNSVYFACPDCRVMADAGYRWAYWKLEHPGIVRAGGVVSARAVLEASDYWTPSEEGDGTKWLIDDVLPTVRDFLTEHEAHRLTFGDTETIAGPDPEALFDWIEVGRQPELTPRHFVEVMKFGTWPQVLAWLEASDHKPWWWYDTDSKDSARRRFESQASLR